MKPQTSSNPLIRQLDLLVTLFPFFCIVALCILFVLYPDASSQMLGTIRFILGDELGSYYLLVGLGFFGCSLYLAFSKYGRIKLGDLEKPQYSNFRWGSICLLYTSHMTAPGLDLAAKIISILSQTAVHNNQIALAGL